jgi:hypothetical protein
MNKLSFFRYVALSLLIASSGCLLDDGIDQDLSSVEGNRGVDDVEVGQGGGFDRDDCKVEDDDLGRVGVLIDLNGVQITFEEWITKDGEPGEYIGFVISVDGADQLSYTVKAGTDRFPGQGSVWMHPIGTGGSEVSAISHIDFCDGLPDGGDPGNGDPGDGDPGDGDPGDGDPGDQICFDDGGCAANEFCNADNVCVPRLIVD